MSKYRTGNVTINSRRLLVNKAKCLKCNETVESTHRHDFRQCSCGNLAVDGGLQYARRVFTNDQWEELAIYAPASVGEGG